MQIVVKVSAQETELLPGSPVEEATKAARLVGTDFVPQHPGSRDPELARWYVAELQDPAAAERLARALRDTPGVEAAYVKPADEPAAPP